MNQLAKNIRATRHATTNMASPPAPTIVLYLCFIFTIPTYSSATSPFIGSTSFLEDAKCSIETIENANTKQLHSILREVVDTTFFRLFRVRLDSSCQFWPKEGAEKASEKECAGPLVENPLKKEAEPACALDVGEPFPKKGKGGIWDAFTKPAPITHKVCGT